MPKCIVKGREKYSIQKHEVHLSAFYTSPVFLKFLSAVLSVRFEVGVCLLLAPAGADKRGLPLVENAGTQLAICKRVPAGAPAGAGSY